MEYFDVIRKRRSIRAFTGETIPQDHIALLVEAGCLAPSGYNRQVWDFVTITDLDVIKELAGDAEWITRAGVVIAVVMDTSSEFWVEDAAAATENILLAAVALGYGACWLGGDTAARESSLKTLLGIPRAKRLFTLIPVGVPAEAPEREKKTLDSLWHMERW